MLLREAKRRTRAAQEREVKRARLHRRIHCSIRLPPPPVLPSPSPTSPDHPFSGTRDASAHCAQVTGSHARPEGAGGETARRFHSLPAGKPHRCGIPCPATATYAQLSCFPRNSPTQRERKARMDVLKLKCRARRDGRKCLLVRLGTWSCAFARTEESCNLSARRQWWASVRLPAGRT
ncbi:hypothetical protein PYCCODRAFT_782874 [Trametes coccinea BRFM310]|uniref:Uncharacterized protein n=1 Tax=Trametes coccinea (strain BRFM310) TaxID=1353009 RepID=A0A1Y2J2C0_TRAC3|nr:hypothetical protein PYCCODRAFT_782874 [Trametes coccinea BRFM310]